MEALKRAAGEQHGASAPIDTPESAWAEIVTEWLVLQCERAGKATGPVQQ